MLTTTLAPSRSRSDSAELCEARKRDAREHAGLSTGAYPFRIAEVSQFLPRAGQPMADAVAQRADGVPHTDHRSQVHSWNVLPPPATTRLVPVDRYRVRDHYDPREGSGRVT